MAKKHKAEHKEEKQEVELTLNKTLLAATILVILLAVVIFLFIKMPRGPAQDVLATVNSQPIPTKDFLKLYEQMPQKDQVSKAEFLNMTITEFLMLQRANKLKLDASEADAEKYINDVLAQSGTPAEEFWKRAAEQGSTKEEVIALARNRLLMNKLIEKDIIPKINVTLEEAEAYYNVSPDKFTLSEQIKASHILVANESFAKSLINKLRSAKNVSTKFGELAINYSQDPGSAVKGGDLGFFTKGLMVKEFEDAAYNLSIGQYTKTPVKTQFGYHIILLTDRQPSKLYAFAEVKDQILKYLFNQKTTEEVRKYSDTLRAKASIKINQAEYAKLANDSVKLE